METFKKTSLCLCLALAGCNENDHDGSLATLNTKPNTPPIVSPTSSSTQLGGNAQTAILQGVGQVTMSANDAKNAPHITLNKTQNSESAINFAVASRDLDIASGNNYEFEIDTTVMPTENTVIDLNVPAELVAQFEAGRFLGVYFERTADEEGEGTFIAVNSNFDHATGKILAQIPPAAFSILSADGKSYKARLKIAAVASNDSSSTLQSNLVGIVASTLQSKLVGIVALPVAGEAKVAPSSLSKFQCPSMADKTNQKDCIEVSIFGQRLRWDKDKSATYFKPHQGIDIRSATGDVIVAAMDGQVFLPNPNNWGTVIIQSGNKKLKYMHLSKIDVKNDDKVLANTPIGLAGTTAPQGINIAPHLHFEYISSVTEVCAKNKKGQNKCITSNNYSDPFPALVSEMKIVRTENKESVSQNETFRLHLEAKDTKGTKILSEINNAGAGYPKGQLRTVTWDVNDKTILDAKPSEILTEQQSFPFKISQSPTLRNQSTVTVLNEGKAAVSAYWQGLSLDVAAKYEIIKGKLAATKMQVTSSPEFPFYDEEVVFSAKMNPEGLSTIPTGTVKIVLAGRPSDQFCAGSLNTQGVATCVVRSGLLGNHFRLKAIYSGDNNFASYESEVFEMNMTSSSYMKIGATGERLSPSSTEWSCMLDRKTGLMWEDKTNDGGLRDVHHSYTWFNGSIGEPNPNNFMNVDRLRSPCSNTLPLCNTAAYIKAVNTETLCGYSNWRLPDTNEYMTYYTFEASHGISPSSSEAIFGSTRLQPEVGYWTSTISFDQTKSVFYPLDSVRSFWVDTTTRTSIEDSHSYSMDPGVVRLVRSSK